MFNSDFDRRFQQSQRRFDIMFRIVATIIALSFVGIVAFWIFAGTMVFKAAGEIEQQGVKGLVEQIWCGKDKPDCLK
jgi:ABC-type phosphate transport system permease subunit